MRAERSEKILQNRRMVSCLIMVTESLLEGVRCCLLFLVFGTWGDILAGVRTQNNSSLNPRSKLLFVGGQWRDFFILRINRKGPNT